MRRQAAGTTDTRLILRRCLEAFWLKPFDAVWDAAVAVVLRRLRWDEPSLDVGCGDGLFMLLAAGGRLRLEADRYTELTRTRQDGTLISAQPPPRRGTVGLDDQARLLERARQTGAYRGLVCGDGQTLPFPNRTFATVFSNALHWLPDWATGLREMRRVVREDGQVVLVVPHARIAGFLHRTLRARGFAWIDRGRFARVTRVTGDRETWRLRLAEAGLRLTASVPVLDRTTIAQWDWSTRPLLPLLLGLTGLLQRLRLKVFLKRPIVSLLSGVMRPWLRRSLTVSEDSCAMWVLVASPV